MNAITPTETAVVPSDSARSIENLIATVSASRLTCFQQCRLKFYFRYVLGLVKPKSPALHVGSTIHSVLRRWNMMRWRGEQASLKALYDVFNVEWDQHQQEEQVEWQEEREDELKKMGWKLLETYFRESPIPADEKPEAVEVSVAADLSALGLPSLIGVLDLVRSGGRIVDFKSSGKTPNAGQVAHTLDTQITAYAVLYRECTGHQESGIELHHLVKTKTPKLVVTALPPADDVQEHRLYHVMESYVCGLQTKDWVPSPGLQCASCQFFNECRAWC